MKTARNNSFTAQKIRGKIITCLLAALNVAGPICTQVLAEQVSYSFAKLAALGETAPGGAQYFFDFETGQINNRGDVIYVADLTTDGVNDIGEGVFLASH